MTPNQLRQTYLDYFKQRGHAIVPSAPIVPQDDPTTLFTGSGMQPMLPYLLGETHPEGKRVADSQRCFRSGDLEEVGDTSHTTYFEMLGNWSFGDYFKQEQLNWIYDFLINQLGFDPNRLYATVYRGNNEIGIGQDDQAIEILQQVYRQYQIEPSLNKTPEVSGFNGERIHFYGDDDNWWSRVGQPEKMPAGEPGGPTSEIFYDFGDDRQLHQNSKYADQVCHINCDCGRFLEIGNSVFMAFIKTKSDFEPLKNKNIDFGGGLERILAALNNDPDVYTTEFFAPIISKLEQLSGLNYADSAEVKRSFRVIADHTRSAVMFALDGIYPGNKDQAYFSRRMIRRAIRYAKMINLDKPFLVDLVPIVVEIYRQPYPEIKQEAEQIKSELAKEEAKFRKTLNKGIKEFEKLSQSKKLSGKDAFYLYETFGFPLEITQEMAAEKGFEVDAEEFAKHKRAHADKSRSASAGKFKGGLADHSQATTKLHTATHLLHKALRNVLGEHVQQQGSNITAERLRFDFTHSVAITDEQLQQIETEVNQKIKANLPVTKSIEDKQQALDSGAMAFFKEKYPDRVSVYTIGDQDQVYSKELCGGPHVDQTGVLGRFELYKQQSIGAGKRRVYARLIED